MRLFFSSSMYTHTHTHKAVPSPLPDSAALPGEPRRRVKVDAACAPLCTKTVIMACHYGAAEQRRALQQPGERGDVPLPLFTSQLITILLNALQTARRQPSHVCVHETLGRGGARGVVG